LQSTRKVGVTVVQRFVDPPISIDALCEAQPATGRVRLPAVTVDYPSGLEPLAREVAGLVPQMAAFVKREFGIRWCWDAQLRLLRVDRPPARFIGRRARLRTGVFPAHLFVPPDATMEGLYRANRLFPASFVHEMTELSLAFPPKGNNPVLLDYDSEDFREVNYTRWFRDGLACYVGERVAEEFCGRPVTGRLHLRPFSALPSLGELIFEWLESGYSVSDDSQTRFADLYRACMGFFYLLEQQHGRAAIRAIVAELPHAGPLNRNELVRIFEKVTGKSPRRILRGLHLPWLGVRGQTLTRATSVSRAISFTPGVLVLAIADHSPARDAGLLPGDILVSVGGEPTPTDDELERVLFRLPGTEGELLYVRDGERRRASLTLRPRSTRMAAVWAQSL